MELMIWPRWISLILNLKSEKNNKVGSVKMGAQYPIAGENCSKQFHHNKFEVITAARNRATSYMSLQRMVTVCGRVWYLIGYVLP